MASASRIEPQTDHAAPLRLHRAVVRPDWVDYNGHMTESAYVLVFGHATDAFLDYVGLDEAARRRTSASLYTVESHIHYLREVREGAALEVTTQLVAHDAKRCRIYHEMFAPGIDGPVVASELMLLHVDKAGPRAAPFAPEVLERVAAIASAHAALPPPRYPARAYALGAAR
jgi:acyl-CoA thioester hydrolase